MCKRRLHFIALILWALPLPCKSGFAQTSSDPTSLERYAVLGQKALQEGRYPDAEAAFEKLRKLSPGTAEVYANLGAIYFQEKKFDKGVPVLRQALKLKPNLPKTEALLVMSLSELGRYKEALPGLEKSFRQSSDPELKRLCGLHLQRAYTNLHLDSKSIETGLELARLYPNDPEVLYHNGKIFGNYAFLAMEKLWEVAPDSIWRYQSAAEAYQSQENTELAISGYRKVLEMDPSRPGLHYRLGQVLLTRARDKGSAEDSAEAMKQFGIELQLDPGNANAAYEIAESYREAGQLDDSQKYFEMALKNYPDFEEAHVGIAAALMGVNKADLAVAHLEKATALNPSDEVAWYRLARAYGAVGNDAGRKKALGEFQRLHSRKLGAQEASRRLFAPSEVTRQELDPNATQPQ
jgi:tetratricopeptide (TPR) repeat protein